MSTNCSSSLLSVDAPVDEVQPLTTEMMVASLATIGSNADGRLVYARWNLSSLRLTSVEVLSSYRYVQHLSLDNNKIHSLEPLRELHDLVYLSAVNNKLGDDVFDSLASSGTTLERLNLSGNSLTSLGGLRQLPFLMEFTATQNAITEIADDDVECLHSLTRVNLMHNSIRRVAPNAFAKSGALRCLDLSHNMLRDATFVVHLAENLETLNLEHNGIESLLGFGVMGELVWLHLAHNSICSWEELERLSGLPNLRALSLEGNPLLQVVVTDPAATTLKDEVKLEVAHDVDFAATRVSSESCSNTATGLNNVQLIAMAAPPARGLVHHLPPAPHGPEEWNDDGEEELAKLPQMEQHRAHVISILRQLSMLDSVEVKPEEIPRAMRLFKKRRVVAMHAAGSAARAVELKRVKVANCTA